MILPDHTLPRSVHEAASMLVAGAEALEILRLRQCAARGENPSEIARSLFGRWLVQRWELYDTSKPISTWCRAHLGTDDAEKVLRAVLESAAPLVIARAERTW